MKTVDLLRLALRNALRGKLRSALAITAIAIGVAATLFISAAGDAATAAVSEQLDSLGISGTLIYPTKVASTDGIQLKGEDAAAVMASVDGAESAMPLLIKYGTYKIKNWQGNSVIYGIDSSIGELLDLKLLHGRYPTAREVEKHANVAVVSSDFAEKVYRRPNITGKKIWLSCGGAYSEYEIIGVISPQSAGISMLVGESIPMFIYIPYTSAQIMTGESGVDQLLIGGDDPEVSEKAVEYLDRRYGGTDSFTSEDISGLRRNIDRTLDLTAIFLTAIAAVSMAVAGIGVMTTMLSNAAERRREIGVYMSIGARRRDIALEFLAESALISLIGALAGAAAVFICTFAVGKFTGIDVTPPVRSAVITVASALIFGIIFGVTPAVKASGLDPIDALRDN